MVAQTVFWYQKWTLYRKLEMVNPWRTVYRTAFAMSLLGMIPTTVVFTISACRYKVHLERIHASNSALRMVGFKEYPNSTYRRLLLGPIEGQGRAGEEDESSSE